MMDAPTYQVEVDFAICRFKCACGLVHTHGAPEKRGKPEHRVAHCVDGTHKETGYYIVAD